jgi:hypothetical protein
MEGTPASRDILIFNVSSRVRDSSCGGEDGRNLAVDHYTEGFLGLAESWAVELS